MATGLVLMTCCATNLYLVVEMIWKAQHAFKYMLYTGCVLTPTHSVKTCYTIQSSQQQLLFWYIYVHKMLCFCIINSTKRAPSFSFSRISARWKPKHRLVQLTFISKEMEEGKKKKNIPSFIWHTAWLLWRTRGVPMNISTSQNGYYSWVRGAGTRCAATGGALVPSTLQLPG